MKKIFAAIIVPLAIFGVLSVFLPYKASAAEINLTGNWLLLFNHNGHIQTHDMLITNQDQNGNLSGTGGYPRGEAYSITWKLENSQIQGTDVKLAIHYNKSDYVAKLSGTIQPNGIMSGAWTDNRGLNGKWGAVPDTFQGQVPPGP